MYCLTLSRHSDPKWKKSIQNFSFFTVQIEPEKSFGSNRKQVLKKERSFFSWGCTDKTNEKPAGSGILFDSLASGGEQLLAKLLYRSHTGRHHRLKSTTIAKDFRPTAMVGKVWVHSYGHR